MLITDVRTQLVEFPFDAPFYPAWARGRNMPALQMVLIRVETDEGPRLTINRPNQPEPVG